jgi:hypothetical protein
VCARPEPDLAPAARPTGSPDERRAAVAHWASTHPGPGLGAGSGYLVAKAL